MIDLLPIVGLVFARTAAALMVAPPFAHRAVPWPARLGLAAALTVPLAVGLPTAHAAPSGAVSYLAAFIHEAAFGLVLGFAVQLVFRGAEIAGHLMDAQLRFSWGDVFGNPAGEPATPVAQLLYLMAMAAFLLANGHHLLFEAWHRGLMVLPPGGGEGLSWAGLPLVRALTECFLFALQAAAPLVALLFLFDIVTALVARVEPRLPLDPMVRTVRPAAGILGLALTLPLVWPIMRHHLHHLPGLLNAFAALLAGGGQ